MLEKIERELRILILIQPIKSPLETQSYQICQQHCVQQKSIIKVHRPFHYLLSSCYGKQPLVCRERATGRFLKSGVRNKISITHLPTNRFFSIFLPYILVDESMTWIASLQNATAHGACATALTIKPANVNTLVATSRVHARAILHATRIVICISRTFIPMYRVVLILFCKIFFQSNFYIVPILLKISSKTIACNLEKIITHIRR